MTVMESAPNSADPHNAHPRDGLARRDGKLLPQHVASVLRYRLGLEEDYIDAQVRPDLNIEVPVSANDVSNN